MTAATDDARLLVEAIARTWSTTVDLLGADRPEFEADLLVRLRALDAALEPVRADDERVRAAQGAVMALFQAQPRALEHLTTTLGEAFDGVERFDGPVLIPGAVAHARYLEIPVLYGTDRAAVAPSEPDESSGSDGERGEPSYGVVWVSIPDDHRMGGLEKPRWWRLEFRTGPAEYVVALRTEPLPRAEFVTRAGAGVTTADGREALVFVHGYNVTFVDAARRAAQLAFDLQFDGLPMLYSWPSEGAFDRYLVDGENAQWSTANFHDYLRLAATEIGAERVHVIAHSMGNRLLVGALAALEPDAARRLGQIVFAAPDIDAAFFVQRATALTEDFARDFADPAAVPGRTLYANSKDVALRAAQKLVKHPRAGQSGADIVVVAGVDTIDATELDTGLMSHSYFGDRTSVLGDIFDLIRDREPRQRFGLMPRTTPGGLGYWIFKKRRN